MANALSCIVIALAMRVGPGCRQQRLDLEQLHRQSRVHPGDRDVTHDVRREPSLVVFDVRDAHPDEIVGYSEHAPQRE